MRQGQYFLVNISARLLNISSSSNLIPNFVLLVSRLPNIVQKTACTRNEDMVVTFQMKYVSAFKEACNWRYQAETAAPFLLNTMYRIHFMVHIYGQNPNSTSAQPNIT